MSAEKQSYRARWILPVQGEPIADGTVEIEGRTITAVHAAKSNPAQDLGNVAVIPGLVNAHTHLEFSELTRPLTPPHPFEQWLRAVMAHRRKRLADPQDAILRGCAESRLCGTTLIGEIATQGWPPSLLDPNQPRIVVFRELIGLPAERIREQLSLAEEHLKQSRSVSETNVLAGISPHAPYSVHPDLFHRLVELAGRYQAPLAIHLAETEPELELLSSGSGELRRFLDEVGVWQPGVIERGTRPLDYLRALTQLDRGLVVHGNYLSDEEIEFIAAHPNLSVVYCPRTHAYFGHREHPWLRILERGGAVALGTDSRASNPDLSVWNELRFLRRNFVDVEARRLLRLATIDGARALGLDASTGSLQEGKLADLTVVSLSTAAASDPDRALFHKDNRVVATMRGGRWLARNVSPTS